jgi:periplasmic divalent cation tolerance protein
LECELSSTKETGFRGGHREHLASQAILENDSMCSSKAGRSLHRCAQVVNEVCGVVEKERSYRIEVGETLMAQETKFRVVLVTCATLEEARKIARAVVEQGLAACVNIVTHAVESFYTWEGKLENGSEYLLLIKTSAAQLDALEKEIGQLHSYDTPEFIALPIVAGSEKYLNWLEDSVNKP